MCDYKILVITNKIKLYIKSIYEMSLHIEM